MVTSEWGTPDTFENGLIPEVLLGSKYGRKLHFGICTSASIAGDRLRRGASAVFELRPAHDPTKAYGFVNCVISLKDLSVDLDL